MIIIPKFKAQLCSYCRLLPSLYLPFPHHLSCKSINTVYFHALSHLKTTEKRGEALKQSKKVHLVLTRPPLTSVVQRFGSNLYRFFKCGINACHEWLMKDYVARCAWETYQLQRESECQLLVLLRLGHNWLSEHIIEKKSPNYAFSMLFSDGTISWDYTPWFIFHSVLWNASFLCFSYGGYLVDGLPLKPLLYTSIPTRSQL